MRDEENIREPHENVQATMFLIPDYRENESAIVFKIHHSMMDGQAFGSFYSVLCEEYDGSKVPTMPSMAWWKWLMIYMMLPVLVPYMGLKLAFMHKDSN